MKRALLSAALFGGAISLPQAAEAGTIIQHFGTEFSGVQGFDGSLGRLDQVIIEVDSTLEGNFVLPHRDEPFADAHYGGFADLSLRFFDSVKGNEAAYIAAGMNFPFGSFSYNEQPSAYSYGFMTHRSLTRTRSASDPVALEALMDFTTPYFIDIHAKSDARFGISYTEPMGGTSNVTVHAASEYTSYLGTVTYIYSDVMGVPEPESWTLLIIGFGVLGGAMRGRRGRAPAGQARLIRDWHGVLANLS